MTRITWHWPIFERPLCGEIDDRVRLGLPERFVSGPFDSSVLAAYEALRSADRAHLLAVVESASHGLSERIAAGNLLALVGDPRIQADAPGMVEIDGGIVHVGLPFDEVDLVMTRLTGLGLERRWIEKECPRHTVSIGSFRLARYPVTNLEYREFLLDTAFSELPSSWTTRRFPIERANHPVYTVSVQAATVYCAWLARRTRRHFRLPTEVEWEYAAAGADGREYPWGAEFDPYCANTAESGLFTTTPVGVFPEGRSPFGIADMAGNVEEYVADRYAPYPGGHPVVDHLVELNATYHVARGGCFSRFRDLARTRRRHGHNPRSETYAMGFRVAESLD